MHKFMFEVFPKRYCDLELFPGSATQFEYDAEVVIRILI